MLLMLVVAVSVGLRQLFSVFAIVFSSNGFPSRTRPIFFAAAISRPTDPQNRHASCSWRLYHRFRRNRSCQRSLRSRTFRLFSKGFHWPRCLSRVLLHLAWVVSCFLFS